MTRGEDGEALVDLMVASSLVVLLTAVLVLLLGVSEVGLRATSSKAIAEARGRLLLEGAARDIRAARSIGWCPSAARGAQYSTPASQCAHIGEYAGWPPGASVPGGPLIYVDARQLWFWDYGTDAGPLATPDCVQLHVTSNAEMLFDRWAGSGTFTTASCPGVTFMPNSPPTSQQAPATSRFVGALAGGAPGNVFRATDAEGNVAATPEAVVLVSVSTVFTFGYGRTSRGVGVDAVDVEAAVRGAVYQSERHWNAA